MARRIGSDRVGHAATIFSSSGGIAAPVAASVGPEFEELLEDDDTCVVCMERPRNALFMPCRHTITCLDCALQIHAKLSLCPYCRVEVENVFEIG